MNVHLDLMTAVKMQIALIEMEGIIVHARGTILVMENHVSVSLTFCGIVILIVSVAIKC